MTEDKIFRILLERFENSDQHFDNPTLQVETVNSFSKSLSNIIYESFKNKSSASHSKRNNVLKFINKISEAKNAHVHFGTEKLLKLIKQSFEADAFHFQCNKLEPVFLTTADGVISFYQKKNLKEKHRNVKLEYIRKRDQEILDNKYNMYVKRNFTHYDVSENILQDTLKYNDYSHNIDDKISYLNSVIYRSQQIKLGYSVKNMNNSESTVILQEILQRLSTYETLQMFEENFLYFLWTTTDENWNPSEIFLKSFFFIIERIIVETCTKILCLNEGDDHIFLLNLGDDKNIVRIRNICKKNFEIYVKLRSLIHELYCYSFCNKNVLKLCNSII